MCAKLILKRNNEGIIPDSYLKPSAKLCDLDYKCYQKCELCVGVYRERFLQEVRLPWTWKRGWAVAAQRGGLSRGELTAGEGEGVKGDQAGCGAARIEAPLRAGTCLWYRPLPTILGQESSHRAAPLLPSPVGTQPLGPVKPSCFEKVLFPAPQLFSYICPLLVCRHPPASPRPGPPHPATPAPRPSWAGSLRVPRAPSFHPVCSWLHFSLPIPAWAPV